MNCLKSKKRETASFRNAQELMIDTLNVFAQAYAVVLHEDFGFGTQRLNTLTDKAIALVHDEIANWDKEYAGTHLEMRCASIPFYPGIHAHKMGKVER